ncbi:hypothetical protein HG531_004186 [Fusarium graminearum]|nr:hypothetical protein HG531_004186 [Fusarium graminearum]
MVVIECALDAKHILCLSSSSSSNLGRLLNLELKKRLSNAIDSLTGGLDLLCSLFDVELLVGPERILHVALLADTNESTLSSPVRGSLDVEASPDLINGLDKLVAVLLYMTGCRGNAETFLTNWNGGVVDGLDIDSVVVEKHVGSRLCGLGVADQNRNDVRGIGDDRDVTSVHSLLDSSGVQLLESSITIVLHLVLDRGLSTSHGGRRQRGSENEARSHNDVDSVHDGSARGTVSMGFPVKVLSNTSTMRTVHADSMDFIEKSYGAVLVGKITDFLNGANGATHTVHRLKSNNLGHVQGQRSQLGLKILHIVVLENNLLGARVSNSLDHRGMVQAVGQNNAFGQLATKCCQGCVVGDITRAEHKSAILGMKLG